MLVNVVAMNKVQVTVVKKIRVPVEPDADMPATRAMLVVMSLMHLAILFFHACTPQVGKPV